MTRKEKLLKLEAKKGFQMGNSTYPDVSNIMEMNWRQIYKLHTFTTYKLLVLNFQMSIFMIVAVIPFVFENSLLSILIGIVMTCSGFLIFTFITKYNKYPTKTDYWLGVLKWESFAVSIYISLILLTAQIFNFNHAIENMNTLLIAPSIMIFMVPVMFAPIFDMIRMIILNEVRRSLPNIEYDNFKKIVMYSRYFAFLLMFIIIILFSLLLTLYTGGEGTTSSEEAKNVAQVFGNIALFVTLFANLFPGLTINNTKS